MCFVAVKEILQPVEYLRKTARHAGFPVVCNVEDEFFPLEDMTCSLGA